MKTPFTTKITLSLLILLVFSLTSFAQKLSSYKVASKTGATTAGIRMAFTSEKEAFAAYNGKSMKVNGVDYPATLSGNTININTGKTLTAYAGSKMAIRTATKSLNFEINASGVAGSAKTLTSSMEKKDVLTDGVKSIELAFESEDAARKAASSGFMKVNNVSYAAKIVGSRVFVKTAKFLSEFDALNEDIDFEYNTGERMSFDFNASGDRFGVQASPPLPIELVSFSASLSNDASIAITWLVEMEINVRSYLIERSFDGRNFEAIHEITNIKNSTELKSYTFSDRSVNRTIHKVAYYRIRNIDYDESFGLSDVRSVKLTTEVDAIQVNPTLTSGFININTVEPVHVQVYDFNGKIVLEKNNVANSINIDQLSPGHYVLRLNKTNGSTQTARIVKY